MKTSLNLLLREKVLFPKKKKEYMFCVGASVQVAKAEPLWFERSFQTVKPCTPSPIKKI